MGLLESNQESINKTKSFNDKKVRAKENLYALN